MWTNKCLLPLQSDYDWLDPLDPLSGPWLLLYLTASEPSLFFCFFFLSETFGFSFFPALKGDDSPSFFLS